jgi:DNA-binding transcriptional ArsR family regulator
MRHGLTPSRQAVSQHLDVLVDAGLVRRRREGRYTFLELDTAPLRQVADRWRIPDREDPS